MRYNFDERISHLLLMQINNSDWCVGNVTDMSQLFSMSRIYGPLPNEDLSRWDVSNVQDMSGMFDGQTDVSKLGISSWDVSNVVSFRRTFARTDGTYGNLSVWNLSSAVDLTEMFFEASSFDQNLCTWAETLPLNVDIDDAFFGTECISRESRCGLGCIEDRNPNSTTNTNEIQFTTVVLDSSGDVGIFPSMSVDYIGAPVISYSDSVNSTLKVLKCGDAKCSNILSKATLDPGITGRISSLALGSKSLLPIISYCSDEDQQIKLVHCGDATCSRDNTFTEITGNRTGTTTDLVVGSDGRPVLLFDDDGGNSLKLLICGNPSCTEDNAYRTFDSSTSIPFEGRTPPIYGSRSLALSAGGMPRFIWHDSSEVDNSHIKVCWDRDCVSTLGRPNFVEGGMHNTMALDKDDLPVFAYFSPANNELRVAKCGSVDCEGGISTETVDTGVGENSMPSIVIDPATNRPIVSYHDDNTQALKLLVCGSARCASGNAIIVVDSYEKNGGDVGYYSSLALQQRQDVTSPFPPVVVGHYDRTNGDLKLSFPS